MKTHFVYSRQIGLGMALAAAIRVAVEAAPLPAKTKARLRNCIGCKRRAAWLDRIGRGQRTEARGQKL